MAAKRTVASKEKCFFMNLSTKPRIKLLTGFDKTNF